MGIQKEYESIGRWGCYLLCLIKASGKNVDEALNYYRLFLSKQWIDEGCYVKNPVAILKYLTGKDYSVKKSAIKEDADVVIEYWYNKATGLHHFVLRQKNGELFDPLGKSNTVANGKVESYRLFYRG